MDCPSCPCCKCFPLTECYPGTGSSIKVFNSSLVAGTNVRFNGKCWDVGSVTANCNGAVNLPSFELVDDCDAASCDAGKGAGTDPVMWELLWCGNQENPADVSQQPTIYTTDELSPTVVPANLIVVLDTGHCYVKSLVLAEFPTTPVVVVQSYPDCILCKNTGASHVFSDCDGIEDDKYTSVDRVDVSAISPTSLQDLVDNNKVVKISGSTSCWNVNYCGPCDACPGVSESITVTEQFDSCPDCFGCDPVPFECDDCCYSSGSKALFTYYKYTCEYDDIGCNVEDLIAIRYSTMIKIANGSKISLDWISANTWRSSTTHDYQAGTTLSGCPPTAPEFQRYVWLHKHCTTGDWEYAVTPTISAPSSYTPFIIKITDTVDCCVGDKQVDNCVDTAPRFPASIKTFVNHKVVITTNGCCYNGSACEKNTVVCADGKCSTAL